MNGDKTSADTSPDVDRLYRSLLMQRSGVERMSMGAAMFDAARAMVIASVHARTIGSSEADTREVAFTRIYASDLDERTRNEVFARVRRNTHKRWLDNWKRVGPLLEAERWQRLRNMSDEEARRTVKDVHDLWQDDWVGDAGEELLLHQQTFARARRKRE